MTARAARESNFDIASMRPLRTSSFSSDVMSNSAKSAGAGQQTPHANPPPAFIAASEASDLITAELDRTVIVSQPALTLLNEFLDHVLFCIISSSHSVALGQLRAAVPVVLKPRLGKAALRVAEEELKEYIEDEEAEELYSDRNSLQPKYDFDTELVWKLARLRCMVYARMGDLEEEDEEEWLEKENLLEQAAASPVASRKSMAITPGSAIFLTSVIEYLGEQALYYAAQHAQKRHDTAQTPDSIAPTPGSQLAARHEDIILDGKDMNHVGRDSPLSRLWRSWRRNTRTPAEVGSRPLSPDTMLSPGTDSVHSRTTSSSMQQPIHTILEEGNRTVAEMPVPETPSQIPLPMSDNDIAEIEGFFLAETNATTEDQSRRRLSMPNMPGRFPSDIMIPIGEVPPPFQERSPLRPRFDRRASSLPALQTPYVSAADEDRDSLVLPIQQQPDSELVDDLALHEEVETAEKQDAAVDEITEPAEERPISARETEQVLKQGSARQSPISHAKQSSEQLNATVGVLAGALGAVGVHHIKQNTQSSDGESIGKKARKQPTPTEQPITSASIKGPSDFDGIYVPEARSSPENQDPRPLGKTNKELKRLSIQDRYENLKQQQMEEHKRYSQTSHEMDTPSIYSHREHSPRFPQDMRSSGSFDDEADHIATRPLPDREPMVKQPQRSRNIVNTVEATASQPQTADSNTPVSPVSSKTANRRMPATTDVVPDIPATRSRVQLPVDEYAIGRSRGHSKSSSSSSRLLGFTRDANGRPQTIHQQRAAGDMTDDMRQAHSSTPSAGQRSRPTTAASSSPSKRQHVRVRGDSDNNVMRAMPDNESTTRSLEVLINSDETLHYTLTPATATFRDEDLHHSPGRTETQDLADFIRTTGPSRQVNATPKTRIGTSSTENSRSTQVQPIQTSNQRQVNSGPTPVTLQKPPQPKGKNPLGEPRDAKVEREGGVRDLADYMRTTGPETEDQLPRAIVGGPVAAYKSGSIKSSTSPTSVHKTAPRATNRLKFQARDARPSRHGESSALIDFIREGPPREEGDHRINRHIAPFRTTMDSDDLNALASSLQKNSSDTNGIRSSDTATLNSTTPLVSHSARAGTVSQRTIPEDEDHMPTKTRRRVKDPYAIDDSDDDIFGDEPAAKPQTTEESLIDFLRNTAPPPSMTAQPILPSAPQRKTNLNRTPSVDRIKDLVRGARTTAPVNDRTTQIQNQSRARADSPHLTQTGSKLDSYRPTQATHASHVDRNRASKVYPTRSDSRAESRASTANERERAKGVGATADLADYLRNTGPPPSSQQAPQPFILSNRPQMNGTKVPEKKEGLKKFFSMRRK